MLPYNQERRNGPTQAPEGRASTGECMKISLSFDYTQEGDDNMEGLTFEAVQNLGVAVVMCLIMAAFVKYMFDKFMAYLSAEQESHKAEMSEMTTAVNNNTTALANIMTILERMDDNENESG